MANLRNIPNITNTSLSVFANYPFNLLIHKPLFITSVLRNLYNRKLFPNILEVFFQTKWFTIKLVIIIIMVILITVPNRIVISVTIG